MASASQGERAVAGLEDGESAVPMSVEGELAVPIAGDGKRAVVGSAEGGGTLLRSLEYPCTARLRRRRLLAYLRGHSCDEIYEAAKEKICVIFHVRDLVKQVKAGQLREAYYYIRSFAPINQSSSEASLLALFLQDLMAINCFVNGQTTVASILCDWFISIYRHPVLAKYPCFAALVVDILFLRSNHLRASLDWQLVRNKAAEIAEEMAYKTPELKGRMHYPRGRNDLENVVHVVPVRSSFRQRRQVKNSGQKQSTDIAQYYLQLKMRLPSSDVGENHCFSGSTWYKGEILIAKLEEALQAGRRQVLKQGHRHGYLSNEVFPLKVLLTRGSMVEYPPSSRAHGPEHSSRLHTPQVPAIVGSPEIKSCKLGAVASPEMNSAKRSSFQEPRQDTTYSGNDSKRPRAIGTENYGEYCSSGKVGDGGIAI